MVTSVCQYCGVVGDDGFVAVPTQWGDVFLNCCYGSKNIEGG